MVVIVALGIYPKPILDIINPSVQSTNAVVRPGGDPAPSVPESSVTNTAPTPTSTGSSK
jgi:NADH-quinone oxidoreductase subunit M